MPTLLLCLAACAQQSTKIEEPTPSVSAAAKPSPLNKTYDREFEAETLYALLVAEFAGERRRFDVMLNNYVQQAEATEDLEVVTRAARIARYLNAHKQALDMALLWTELEPSNLEAHYNAAGELLHVGQLEAAADHAQILLENGEKTGFDAIGAKALQGNDLEVSQRLIQRYQDLLQDYPNHLSLWVGLSFLAQHAGQLDLALSSAQKAQTLDPDSFQAAGQETRVLQQMGRTDEALENMGVLVEKNPDNLRLRLQYARSLMKTDLAAAQTQFEVLLEQNPDDEDLKTTLALVQFERGLLEQAAQHFNDLQSSEKRGSMAHYYLGRIDQLSQRDDSAINHFKRVQPGSEYLPALANLCDLLVAHDKAPEALKIIAQRREIQSLDDNMQVGLHLLEAQVLSEIGQYQQSLGSLNSGIARFSQATKLKYARAMLFTRMDNIAAAEQDLRDIIVISPNDAAALNALGYTLADRTERLDEAYDYISRAYELAPEDPAIIDSMGWIEYRRGNVEAALKKLRQAMKQFPDHEIAAHLGEVLWVSGELQQAKAVWRQGLELKPDSNVIHSTLKRLEVDL